MPPKGVPVVPSGALGAAAMEARAVLARVAGCPFLAEGRAISLRRVMNGVIVGAGSGWLGGGASAGLTALAQRGADCVGNLRGLGGAASG